VELLLIRHGRPEREENLDGRPADPPLDASGLAQAAALARWLADEPLDAIYASPLRRARETAAPLLAARGLALRIDEGLSEFDRGESAYIPLEELKRMDPAAYRAFAERGPYASRDLSPFRATVAAAVQSAARAHPGGRVALVCHGGVINAYAAEVLGLEHTIFFEPAYTSVSRFLVARDGTRSVRSLNETAHLRGS
jgi:probable phosphoglycerate mutase